MSLTVHGRRDGLLPTTCWCERHIFALDPELVRRGETLSCGHRDCEPPD